MLLWCLTIFQIFFYILRSEELSYHLLSNEGKRYRHRRNKISLQINVVSWLLEFLSGGLMMMDYLLGISDGDFYHWIYLHIALDTFLCGFLVPFTYVLNTDVIKEFVFSIGWNNTIRKQFLSWNKKISDSWWSIFSKDLR